MKNKADQTLEENRLRLALLKENFAYRDLHDAVKKMPAAEGKKKLRHALKNSYGIRVSLFKEHPEAMTALLDPYKEIDDVPEKARAKIIPMLFNIPAVRLVAFTKENVEEFDAITIPVQPQQYDALASAGYWKMFQVFSPGRMRPEERLLKIDLSQGRKKVEKDFGNFLDALTKDEKRRRFRDEAWTQLKVWKLYRLHRSMPKVAREVGLKLSAAYASYRRAVELIQGKTHEVEMSKRETKKKVTLEEVGGLCKDCPKSATCKVLCPDKLRYIDQDINEATVIQSRQRQKKGRDDKRESYDIVWRKKQGAVSRETPGIVWQNTIDDEILES